MKHFLPVLWFNDTKLLYKNESTRTQIYIARQLNIFTFERGITAWLVLRSECTAMYGILKCYFNSIVYFQLDCMRLSTGQSWLKQKYFKFIEKYSKLSDKRSSIQINHSANVPGIRRGKAFIQKRHLYAEWWVVEA